MPVSIHGKDYKTVAERVAEFRQACPNHTIDTEILRWENDDVVIKAMISLEGNLLASGMAHEVRGSTNINRTSHVENCETSAIGRALAALGYGGTEYASADEVANAIAQQKQQDNRTISETQAQTINNLLQETNSNVDRFCAMFKKESVTEILLKDYDRAIAALNKKKEGMK
jgi:hypothetical protein